MIRKAFKYRFYPESGFQTELFWKTVGCCRFVYNRAVAVFEERRKENARYPSQAELLGKMLSAWKEESPFLREVPHHCLQQALLDALIALNRYFKKKGDFPRRRRRGENCAFRFPDPKQFRCGGLMVTLPKFGDVTWIMHRAMRGVPKSITLSYEGGHFYASVLVEITEDLPVPGEVQSLRAGDLGVAQPVVTDDGLQIPFPRTSDREMERERRLRRAISRRKRGSANRRKAVRALATHMAHRARRRRDAVRKAVRLLFQGVDAVVLEDLRVKNMTASARGTTEEPGRNVAQKSGLNRSILDVAFGQIRREAEIYAKSVGKRVLAERAAYSSQECSACHHIEAANRPTRDDFCCVACGHAEDADVNAAKVLKCRAEVHLAELCAIWDEELRAEVENAEAAQARRRAMTEARAAKRAAPKDTTGGLPVSDCGAIRGCPRDEAVNASSTSELVGGIHASS